MVTSPVVVTSITGVSAEQGTAGVHVGDGVGVGVGVCVAGAVVGVIAGAVVGLIDGEVVGAGEGSALGDGSGDGLDVSVGAGVAVSLRVVASGTGTVGAPVSADALSGAATIRAANKAIEVAPAVSRVRVGRATGVSSG
ncbi:MAG: hypothetical protein JST33_09735 [Actinobacteria bacterium]|nr:hypothetical protein [Actinomycetota bacterium]